MNRQASTVNVYRALDDLSRQINEAMEETGMSAVQLARAAGCERKIIYPLLSEPYKAPHFGNLIEILNALGMNQITITWRDDDENTH